MQISIGKIDVEEISEVNRATSLKIAGGDSQSASVNISGSTSNGSARASLFIFNIGSNPFSTFGANIDVQEIGGTTQSTSQSFASSGSISS